MLQTSNLGSFFTLNNIAKKNSKLRPSTKEVILVKNGVINTWQIITGDALSFTSDKGLVDVFLVIANLPYFFKSHHKTNKKQAHKHLFI